MVSEGRHLPAERARGVELQLRARSESLRPRDDQLRVPVTALGCCHVCGQFVKSGDGLAMSGGRLLHADCA